MYITNYVLRTDLEQTTTVRDIYENAPATYYTECVNERWGESVECSKTFSKEFTQSSTSTIENYGEMSDTFALAKTTGSETSTTQTESSSDTDCRVIFLERQRRKQKKNLSTVHNFFFLPSRGTVLKKVVARTKRN